LITIHNENVNWVINQIVPRADGSPSILSLDPVIAGGFVLSIYRAVTLYESAGRMDLLKRLVMSKQKSSGIAFGDIDIWFLAESPVYNPLHLQSILISDEIDRVPDLFSSRLRDDRLLSVGLSHVRDVSYWANTFASVKSSSLNTESSYIIQIIRRRHDSVRELLSTFDFKNCMIAWKSGTLYLDRNLNESFEAMRLVLNTSYQYKDGSLAKRVFNALRAIKYAKRYCLDFDADLSQHIFDVYAESLSFDYNSYEERVEFLERVYGTTISSKDTLRDMIVSLMSEFECFARMKTFRPEYAIYLLDKSDSLPGVKKFMVGELKCRAENVISAVV
jgi:hypothetical protein